MAFDNYQDVTLRASAASSGTSGQDPTTTLPESVRSLWVTLNKTVEFDADNVLSVRLQCYLNGTFWVDVPFTHLQLVGAITTAADTTTVVARVPNILDANTDAPPYTYVAYYEDLPSNVVRTIWIASGTTPAHTFSCIGSYQLNRL
jgi:hypothetical protein